MKSKEPPALALRGDSKFQPFPPTTPGDSNGRSDVRDVIGSGEPGEMERHGIQGEHQKKHSEINGVFNNSISYK